MAETFDDDLWKYLNTDPEQEEEDEGCMDDHKYEEANDK